MTSLLNCINYLKQVKYPKTIGAKSMNDDCLTLYYIIETKFKIVETVYIEDK